MTRHLVFKADAYLSFCIQIGDWNFWLVLLTRLYLLFEHMQINHLPGNVVFVSKLDLASSLKTDYHPMSFQLPKDEDSFLDEVSEYGLF